MRFLFRPPAAEATGLLALPWDRAARASGTRPCCWRCRSAASRGTSSASSPAAGTSSRSRRSTSGWPGTSTRCSASSRRRGCRRSRCSASASTGRDDQEAILVTRYLEYSMSYRWLFSSPRGDALGRAAARHAGRAAGPAAPGRRVLGRLLAVEHAVPARRRRPDRLPRRRRDRRALPDAVAGTAGLRRRPRPRAGGRRAARPAVRRAAARRTSTRSRPPTACRRATRRCGRR